MNMFSGKVEEDEETVFDITPVHGHKTVRVEIKDDHINIIMGGHETAKGLNVRVLTIGCKEPYVADWWGWGAG
jgi:hypothetical protein